MICKRVSVQHCHYSWATVQNGCMDLTQQSFSCAPSWMLDAGVAVVAFRLPTQHPFADAEHFIYVFGISHGGCLEFGTKHWNLHVSICCPCMEHLCGIRATFLINPWVQYFQRILYTIPSAASTKVQSQLSSISQSLTCKFLLFEQIWSPFEGDIRMFP